jgi:hypothetical protein
VHEFEAGDPGADLGAQGPAAEQMLRIGTGRVLHEQAQALVVTVAGEIDLLTVARLRSAVAAGFDKLRDGEILVIDLTDVTFWARRDCRSSLTSLRQPGVAASRCVSWSTTHVR